MQIDQITALSRALSNETRFNILMEIPADGEKCCKDLSDCFEVSKPTVTHHVNKLKDLGLIEGKKEKTFHYLTRNQEKLEDYLKALKENLLQVKPVVDSGSS
jgi:ArsR family transcriptional regulator